MNGHLLLILAGGPAAVLLPLLLARYLVDPNGNRVDPRATRAGHLDLSDSPRHLIEKELSR